MIGSVLEEKIYLRSLISSVEIKPTKKILNPSAIPETADSGHLNIFGKHVNYTGIKPEDWQTDIFSGKKFPMDFAKKINIRNEPELSAKAIWEINRLQFLTPLALKYRTTKDAKYLDQFISAIQSWKNNNPYMVGVNWYSNIEINLRLITWFLCWEALDADKIIEQNAQFSAFVSDDWLPLIYQHCIYSYKNPSRHSSANNHLISEYAGLFIAASKWDFKESEKWIRYSQRGLETEIVKQHSDQGVNKEEAAEYIQFITDFFLLSFIVGENTSRPFSREYKDRLRKIFDYIYHFLDCKGNFPKYGDEDDGKCFIIDTDETFNNFTSLLTSGAIIFNDLKFKIKGNGPDARNLFLFGEKGIKKLDTIAGEEIIEQSKFYVEEGHFILRKKENDKEIYVHFDAAPLGFLSIAAHGHADALSFIMHLDGHPFFVDCGTYTYHTEPAWRKYFIGTLAHNTIRINKQNQAVTGGPTLWLKHYKTKVIQAESNENFDFVKASHNGYSKFGITHTREVHFEKDKHHIKIIDCINSKKTDDYLVEMPFHLHPTIQVNISNENKFDLSNDKSRRVTLQTDYKLNNLIIHGQTEPEINGWYSKSFMHKEPCQTIMSSVKTSGNTQFETIIYIN
jgi:hypothetical protein